VEDVMRLELRYRSDIDLSQPAMQTAAPNPRDRGRRSIEP
jgi:hypothetical protein